MAYVGVTLRWRNAIFVCRSVHTVHQYPSAWLQIWLQCEDHRCAYGRVINVLEPVPTAHEDRTSVLARCYPADCRTTCVMMSLLTMSADEASSHNRGCA
jgi:hypothetical protein